MKQEYKDAWVEALRSDKYKQVKARLKTENGYCCLGVYAEVRGMKITPNGLNIEINGDEVGYDPLEKEIGVELVNRVWTMNDREGSTFAEIADFVETNVPVEA